MVDRVPHVQQLPLAHHELVGVKDIPRPGVLLALGHEGLAVALVKTLAIGFVILRGEVLYRHGLTQEEEGHDEYIYIYIYVRERDCVSAFVTHGIEECEYFFLCC